MTPEKFSLISTEENKMKERLNKSSVFYWLLPQQISWMSSEINLSEERAPLRNFISTFKDFILAGYLDMLQKYRIFSHF